MKLSRAPIPCLRPFVTRVWVSDGMEPDSGVAAERERVLPSGAAHLAIRLGPVPLRVFAGPGDPQGAEIGCAVVGGARSEAYLRDVSRPVGSVGAMLQPGAAGVVLGVPAHRLAGRHTPLDALWGSEVDRLRERLGETGQPLRQLEIFEAFLAARVPRPGGVPPAIAHALARLADGAPVHAVVDALGGGRRRFVAGFREAVGMAPKRWCRVLRFQRAIELVAARPEACWAEIALTAGYSDQAHLSREFRELAGLSPREFRALSPQASHHVPLRPFGGGRFVQDGGGAPRQARPHPTFRRTP